jgi:hypothetical protein
MMNNRIKALAEQAGLATQHDGIVLTRQVNAAEALDVFANLIIQQAILAVEMKTNTHHIYTSFDEGMVLHTIHNSVKAIKEHFGIN